MVSPAWKRSDNIALETIASVLLSMGWSLTKMTCAAEVHRKAGNLGEVAVHSTVTTTVLAGEIKVIMATGVEMRVATAEGAVPTTAGELRS